jgi:hypothetical protein
VLNTTTTTTTTVIKVVVTKSRGGAKINIATGYGQSRKAGAVAG